jgi:hypothetical protein
MSILKRKEAQAPVMAQERARQHRENERKAEVVEPIRRTWAKVDPSLYTADEAVEFRALWMKARDYRQEEGIYRDDLAALSPKERKRVFQLIDKGLPEHERERQRVLRVRREQRELEAFANDLANQGVPPARRLGLLRGEVALPAEVVELDTLRVSDMGLLVVVLHAWSSGQVPFRGARWSDDGTALYLPKRLQLVSQEANRTYGHDGLPTSLVDLARSLEHLAANDFLAVERDAQGWTVRRGPRLRSLTQPAIGNDDQAVP